MKSKLMLNLRPSDRILIDASRQPNNQSLSDWLRLHANDRAAYDLADPPNRIIGEKSLENGISPILFYMDSAEREQWEKAAAVCRLSLSKWFRRCVVRAYQPASVKSVVTTMRAEAPFKPVGVPRERQADQLLIFVRESEHNAYRLAALKKDMSKTAWIRAALNEAARRDGGFTPDEPPTPAPVAPDPTPPKPVRKYGYSPVPFVPLLPPVELDEETKSHFDMMREGLGLGPNPLTEAEYAAWKKEQDRLANEMEEEKKKKFGL